MIVARRSLFGITTERAGFWVKTLAAWTGGATVIGLYLTDWKVVMGKVPYVRRRFDNND